MFKYTITVLQTKLSKQISTSGGDWFDTSADILPKKQKQKEIVFTKIEQITNITL